MFHRTAGGAINFVMLTVAHENQSITLKEFKDINHWRYVLANEFSTPEGYKRTTYRVNIALFTFSEEGVLVSSYTD